MRVAFYARLAELAGRREWQADLPSGSTVAAVWAAAVTAFPDLAPMSGRISCAVNAEFAPLAAAVADDDEVAFLPPVSGGCE